MQYRTLRTGLGQLKKKLREIDGELETFRDLNMVMSIDEMNPYERYEPEILVGGRIGPEVTIHGPTGVMNKSGELNQVLIKMDASTGSFSVEPLKLK